MGEGGEKGRREGGKKERGERESEREKERERERQTHREREREREREVTKIFLPSASLISSDKSKSGERKKIFFGMGNFPSPASKNEWKDKLTANPAHTAHLNR